MPATMTMASAASLVNMKTFCSLVVIFMLKQLSHVRKVMQAAATSALARSGTEHSGKNGWMTYEATVSAMMAFVVGLKQCKRHADK